MSDWRSGNILVENMSLLFCQSLGNIRYTLLIPHKNIPALSEPSSSCLSTVLVGAVLSTDGIWGDSLWISYQLIMLTESPSLTTTLNWNQYLATSAVTEDYLPLVDGLC